MAALLTTLLPTLEWKEIIPVGSGLPSKTTLPETVPVPPPQPDNKKADKSGQVAVPRRSFAKDPYISHPLTFFPRPGSLPVMERQWRSATQQMCCSALAHVGDEFTAT